MKGSLEGGAEWLGASDRAKTDGYVAYGPKTTHVSMDAIRAAPGALSKSTTVYENSAEVNVTLLYELLPSVQF